jgi:hypothetical protein
MLPEGPLHAKPTATPSTRLSQPTDPFMAEILFATPLWRFQHPQPRELVAFSAHILSLQAQDLQGLEITNQGG